MGSILPYPRTTEFPRTAIHGATAVGHDWASPQPTCARATATIADVAIIDSDDDLRERLGKLLHSVGLRTLLFAGLNDMPARGVAETARCLLTEVRLQGTSGLDFQSRLFRQNIHVPIVFMTAHGDIQMAVRAMKDGAVDFLAKPLRDQDVLDAIAAALDRERELRQRTNTLSDLRARVATLTQREGQILLLATAGRMNKQIAAEIGLSEVTVKMHRGSLMRKMAARTVAELTRMAAVLELPVPQTGSPWPAQSAGDLRMPHSGPPISQIQTCPPRSGFGTRVAALVPATGKFAMQ
jgi:FixJ family two-component response regulator